LRKKSEDYDDEDKYQIEENSGDNYENEISNSPPPSEKYVIDGVEYDKHGNLLSEEFDLGKDGSFNDFSILIGMFYSCGNDLAQKALEKKGFRVTLLQDVGEFINRLNQAVDDVAWIISNSTVSGNVSKFKEAVINYHRKGRGLMIWGDNEPYFSHANIVLPDLVGCTLTGNDYGDKVIGYGDKSERGKFDNSHMIFAGINNLYEGITICYPTIESHKLHTLATSTDNNPCILNCDKGQSNYNDGGRIVVDTGFTKLFSNYWASAGQARYVVNASVWLVDLEGRFGIKK
jgi:hypothetical protein